MSDKDWGNTECLISGPLYSKHRLRVVTGGFSSVHFHAERANRFHVESGTIAVVIWHAWRHQRHLLTTDNTFDVPSLVPHQFQVLESGLVIEEYWPDRGGVVRDDDIVRLCRGGRVDVVELDRLADVLMNESTR